MSQFVLKNTGEAAVEMNWGDINLVLQPEHTSFQMGYALASKLSRGVRGVELVPVEIPQEATEEPVIEPVQEEKEEKVTKKRGGK